MFEKGRNRYLIIFYCFVLTALILDVSLVRRSFSAANVGGVICILFVVLGVFFLRSESVRGVANQNLKISSLFLVAFLIVHFQYYFDLALDPSLLAVFTRKISDPDTLIRSAMISLIGLVCFFIGYLSKHIVVNRNKRLKKLNNMFFLTVLCVFSFMFFAGNFINSINIIFNLRVILSFIILLRVFLPLVIIIDRHNNR